jgi:hypothetical protein
MGAAECSLRLLHTVLSFLPPVEVHIEFLIYPHGRAVQVHGG